MNHEPNDADPPEAGEPGGLYPTIYRVERSTQPARRNKVWVTVYHVLARSEAEAKAKAERRCPQDELDGPTVTWTAEEESDDVVKTGSLFRSP